MSDPRDYQIILAVGRIGAGKDVLGELLVKEAGFTHLAYADPLKEMAATLGGFPARWCYTRAGKESPVPMAPHLTVGQMLQVLGTEVGRSVSPDIWVKHAIQKIATMPGNKFVITDCRFPNEVTAMRRCFPGTAVFYMDRVAGELQGQRDPNHASERGVMEIHEAFCKEPWFYLIPNATTSLDEARSLMRNAYFKYDMRHECFSVSPSSSA